VGDVSVGRPYFWVRSSQPGAASRHGLPTCLVRSGQGEHTWRRAAGGRGRASELLLSSLKAGGGASGRVS
jgi:hypothetical protein